MLLRFMLTLFLLLSLPTSAFAYSYGDPNKEEIAEAFKEIVAKLENNPADWGGAMQAFASKKKEIALEFGDQVAQLLEGNFSQRQKELVLHNYKAVLVLNLERRLNNAELQFADYANAKLLLAKARGTFTVLSPYVDGSTSKKIFAAFDQALTSLGNPGLFGVGTVPADKNAFLKQKNLIASTLNPLFPLKKGGVTQPSTNTTAGSAKSGVVGNPSVPASGNPAASSLPAQSPKPAAANAQSTPKSGQTQPVNQQGTAPSAAVANSAASPAGTKPATDSAIANGNTPDRTASSGAAGQAPAQSHSSSAQSVSSNQATDSAQSVGSNQATDSTQSVSSNQTTDSAQSPASTSSVQSAQSQEPASADHSSVADSKVNPVITLSVIAGLIMVIGAAFWIAKRKKMI